MRGLPCLLTICIPEGNSVRVLLSDWRSFTINMLTSYTVFWTSRWHLGLVAACREPKQQLHTVLQ